jgi:hypothetical protein
MINEQAIDTMTQMLALISKHGKSAYAEVGTDASREHRTRARTVAAMLVRLTNHAVRGDACTLLSDSASSHTEREYYSRAGRRQNNGFMRELYAFQQWVLQFESEPVIGTGN